MTLAEKIWNAVIEIETEHGIRPVGVLLGHSEYCELLEDAASLRHLRTKRKTLEYCGIPVRLKLHPGIDFEMPMRKT